MSKPIEPFSLQVSDVDLNDLRERLLRTRWPDAETVDDTSQGPRLAKIRALVDHWVNGYDWRRCESMLNAFGQHRTEIDGLGIHFLHIRSPEPDALPLLMTHGWPGSVLEFRDVIGPLTDPVAHGGSASEAFHLVIPSLPGFGYSDKPTSSGWNMNRISDAWIELMERLGYDGRWAAQGGDWGAAVTTTLGYKAPAGLVGIHLNMVMFQPTDAERAGATSAEKKMLESAQRYDQQLSGYYKLQNTRPQSIGFSLADSPVGLAAWIYALFQDVSDSGGNPESVFTLDQMLDDIMMYWLPNTGASSARLYWEGMREMMKGGMPSKPMSTPAAISMFPVNRFGFRGVGRRAASRTSFTSMSLRRVGISLLSSSQLSLSMRFGLASAAFAASGLLRSSAALQKSCRSKSFAPATSFQRLCPDRANQFHSRYFTLGHDLPSLQIRSEPGVYFVAINHPPLNLLDASLMKQLDALAAWLQDHREIRVVVFESADADFFIPHGDMDFVKDPEAFSNLELGDEHTRGLNPMMRLHERIRELPQVTIGKVAGLARGGGSEFLMALDMRFAAEETAGLAHMEVLTGIIPGAGATAYLPQFVGRARALEIVLGAELFDAKTAERYGWINRAMPADELDGFVATLARRMANLAPGVLDAARTAIDAALAMPLPEALRIENEQLGVTFAKPAATERTLEALRRGAQTREGERGLERLLNGY